MRQDARLRNRERQYVARNSIRSAPAPWGGGNPLACTQINSVTHSRSCILSSEEGE
jgi:hypothetical protein